MAITASLSLPGISTARPGQQVPVQLAISNSGGVAVTVLSVKSRIYTSGTQQCAQSGYVDSFGLGPGLPNSVPAGGSLTLNSSATFNEPRGADNGTYASGTASFSAVGSGAPLGTGTPNPITQAFDIACTVNSNDAGTPVIEATVATVTVQGLG